MPLQKLAGQRIDPAGRAVGLSRCVGVVRLLLNGLCRFFESAGFEEVINRLRGVAGLRQNYRRPLLQVPISLSVSLPQARLQKLAK